MIAIPRITVKTKIYESDRSLVYQGIRESDRKAVIIKIIKLDYPLPKHLATYRQEYKLISSLTFFCHSGESIIKIKLSNQDTSYG